MSKSYEYVTMDQVYEAASTAQELARKQYMYNPTGLALKIFEAQFDAVSDMVRLLEIVVYGHVSESLTNKEKCYEIADVVDEADSQDHPGAD